MFLRMTMKRVFRKLNISKHTATYMFIVWVVVILAFSAVSFGVKLAKGELLSVSGFIDVFCLMVNFLVLLFVVFYYGRFCSISALEEHEHDFKDYTDCVHKSMRELFDAQATKESEIKELRKKIDELENNK